MLVSRLIIVIATEVAFAPMSSARFGWPDLAICTPSPDGKTSKELWEKVLTSTGMELPWLPIPKPKEQQKEDTPAGAAAPNSTGQWDGDAAGSGPGQSGDADHGKSGRAFRAEALKMLAERGVSHSQIFIFCTDRGPDQVGACGHIMRELGKCEDVLLFWTWCLAHQCHLVVKRQLTRLTKAYFGKIAKLSNI